MEIDMAVCGGGVISELGFQDLILTDGLSFS